MKFLSSLSSLKEKKGFSFVSKTILPAAVGTLVLSLAIVHANVSSSAVNTSDIADGAVTTAKLADGAVTLGKTDLGLRRYATYVSLGNIASAPNTTVRIPVFISPNIPESSHNGGTVTRVGFATTNTVNLGTTMGSNSVISLQKYTGGSPVAPTVCHAYGKFTANVQRDCPIYNLEAFHPHGGDTTYEVVYQQGPSGAALDNLLVSIEYTIH